MQVAETSSRSFPFGVTQNGSCHRGAVLGAGDDNLSRESVDFGPAAQLRAALRRFAHSTEQITRAHGLTPRRYELLLFIESADQSGQPATITGLCDALQTTQGSVTQLVANAAGARLVRRTATPTDKRSHHLHLTDEGLTRLKAAHAVLADERDRLAEIVQHHLLSPTSP